MEERATRRSFVKLAAGAAGVVGLGGIARLLGSRGPFLRPPGAGAEHDLMARCLKCQKCQEACPHGAIAPVLFLEGPAQAGTPRLDYDLGYCDLCLKCVAACPSGALRPVRQESVRLGVARIIQESCIAWSWGGCTRCAAECPTQAIMLDEHGRPVVDAARCNGCGLCQYLCPSASLRDNSSHIGKGIVVVSISEGQP